MSAQDTGIVWADLSDDAKNILEWLENPNSGKLHILSVEVGKLPMLDGNERPLVKAPVSQALFDEISSWVLSRPDEIVVDTGGSTRIVCHLPEPVFGSGRPWAKDFYEEDNESSPSPGL